MRICSKCIEEKEDGEFRIINKKTGGLDCWCKSCRSIENKKWRNNNRDKLIEYAKGRTYYHRNHSLQKNYGIDLEEYNKMYEERNGLCDICAEKFNLLFVDHDHKTGEIRGLLCRKCNSGIGYLKDNSQLVGIASLYLLRGTE